MDVTNGLLVAMMFIMVLSIGIGSILMSAWNLAFAAVFATLAMTVSHRTHVIGAAISWALFVSLMLARGTGVVG